MDILQLHGLLSSQKIVGEEGNASPNVTWSKKHLPRRIVHMIPYKENLLAVHEFLEASDGFQIMLSHITKEDGVVSSEIISVENHSIKEIDPTHCRIGIDETDYIHLFTGSSYIGLSSDRTVDIVIALSDFTVLDVIQKDASSFYLAGTNQNTEVYGIFSLDTSQLTIDAAIKEEFQTLAFYKANNAPIDLPAALEEEASLIPSLTSVFLTEQFAFYIRTEVDFHIENHILSYFYKLEQKSIKTGHLISCTNLSKLAYLKRNQPGILIQSQQSYIYYECDGINYLDSISLI